MLELSFEQEHNESVRRLSEASSLSPPSHIEASMNPSIRWCFLWGYCAWVKKIEILGGNVVLRIKTIFSSNAQIYFTDTNNLPNNIAIPPGIVVRDTTRNLILPQACFQPLGYYLILWYYSYEITYNNQVVVVLSNQEQQSICTTRRRISSFS
ncbi:hypothetical protein RhiirC2_856765 [Rhizophagus irregularis]|uniref:Uncharacterized protein n=1 Tax=Rhizophagus irregularis TaxID=588596 RepID=A0A2N1MG14_9GLOM|nr:hypothetical protein RhiirC2_856765 [Rhizophagus irregularis]